MRVSSAASSLLVHRPRVRGCRSADAALRPESAEGIADRVLEAHRLAARLGGAPALGVAACASGGVEVALERVADARIDIAKRSGGAQERRGAFGLAVAGCDRAEPSEAYGCPCGPVVLEAQSQLLGERFTGACEVAVHQRRGAEVADKVQGEKWLARGAGIGGCDLQQP